eukprot:g12869.t1
MEDLEVLEEHHVHHVQSSEMSSRGRFVGVTDSRACEIGGAQMSPLSELRRRQGRRPMSRDGDRVGLYACNAHLQSWRNRTSRVIPAVCLQFGEAWECVAMAPVNEQDRRKLRRVSIDLLKCEEMQKELEKFKALMETAVGRKLRYFHS